MCLAFSVLVHGGVLLQAALRDAEEVIRQPPGPIAVRLLRIPPPIASVDGSDPPRPPEAAPARVPKKPVRSPRQADPVLPKSAPSPTLSPTPTPEAQHAPEGSRDPAPTQETLVRAETRPEARVYGQREVDRAASPTRAIRPRYPRLERRRGREGSVLLRLRVSANGEVQMIKVAESAGEAFDTAALEALRGERFNPALVDGAPVASVLLYRLRFALR